MSISLMTEVWKLDLPTSDKMVLLALADAANDDGVTWMALESREGVKLDLLKKTSLSRRAVQGALKRLCEAGYLTRVDRPGKGVIWTVKGCTSCAPQQMRPAADAPGGAADAPKPSINPQPSSEANASSEVSARKSHFEIWWEAYPSKVGKRNAEAAYDKARKRLKDAGKDPHATMLAGLLKAKASRRWADPTYHIPNPQTWLNGDRWEDEDVSMLTGPPGAPAIDPSESAALRARHEALLAGKPHASAC